MKTVVVVVVVPSPSLVLLLLRYDLQYSMVRADVKGSVGNGGRRSKLGRDNEHLVSSPSSVDIPSFPSFFVC
jgi:hypothetical protein